MIFLLVPNWRQTGECKPNGPREPNNDKSGNVKIRSHWSGYCECTDGRKTIEKGCSDTSIYDTCNDACSALAGEHCPLYAKTF